MEDHQIMEDEGNTLAMIDNKTEEVLEVAVSDEKKKRKRLKKLLGDIRQQVEFYFSDANLRKDRFLKKEIDGSDERYIHISTVSSFNRMRALTTDQTLIARALETSKMLELNADKTCIRRKIPISTPKYEIDDLTVYVENMPRHVDHDMLKKAFSVCGDVAYVSLPRYKTTNDPKGFAFIEFTTPDEAKKACKLLNNPPQDKPTSSVGHFPTTRKGRLILPDGPVKKLPYDAKNSENYTMKENVTKRKRETDETAEATPSSSDAQKKDNVAPSQKKGKKEKTQQKEHKGAVAEDGPNDKDARRGVIEKSSKRKKAVVKEDCPDKVGKRDGTEKSSRMKKGVVTEVDGKTDETKEKGVATDGQDSNIKKLPKRKLDNADDDEVQQVKRKKESSHDPEENNKQDHHQASRINQGRKEAETGNGLKEQKTSKKRKHSGRENDQDIRSRKSEISDAGATGDIIATTKKLSTVSETNTKRKKANSDSSVDGTKVNKRSSCFEDDAREMEKRWAESDDNEEDEGDGEKKRKRRSRSRKHKEDGDARLMMQLRVLSKKEWLSLKNEYLAIQKMNRQQVKQQLKVHQGSHFNNTNEEGHHWNTCTFNYQEEEVQPKATELEFVAGIVLRISSDKPFASRKDLREQLEEISPVAYVDMNDGDDGGYVRLKSAEGANMVLGTASKLANDNGCVKMTLLSGQDELNYWEKMRCDREAKLNSKTRRKKKRGVDRILDKTEKVLGSLNTGMPKNKHFVFNDE